MFTAQRDASLLTACNNDVVDEAGKGGNAADKEGDHGAPVAAPSWRIAVHTVEVIHVGYGHITTSDDVVAAARTD
jgi:hypothetical protein